MHMAEHKDKSGRFYSTTESSATRKGHEPLSAEDAARVRKEPKNVLALPEKDFALHLAKEDGVPLADLREHFNEEIENLFRDAPYPIHRRWLEDPYTHRNEVLRFAHEQSKADPKGETWTHWLDSFRQHATLKQRIIQSEQKEESRALFEAARSLRSLSENDPAAFAAHEDRTERAARKEFRQGYLGAHNEARAKIEEDIRTEIADLEQRIHLEDAQNAQASYTRIDEATEKIVAIEGLQERFRVLQKVLMLIDALRRPSLPSPIDVDVTPIESKSIFSRGWVRALGALAALGGMVVATQHEKKHDDVPVQKVRVEETTHVDAPIAVAEKKEVLQTYTVKKGDTLWGIAKGIETETAHGKRVKNADIARTVEQLEAENVIDIPSHLKIGTELVISRVTHTPTEVPSLETMPRSSPDESLSMMQNKGLQEFSSVDSFVHDDESAYDTSARNEISFIDTIALPKGETIWSQARTIIEAAGVRPTRARVSLVTSIMLRDSSITNPYKIKIGTPLFVVNARRLAEDLRAGKTPKTIAEREGLGWPPFNLRAHEE